MAARALVSLFGAALLAISCKADIPKLDQLSMYAKPSIVKIYAGYKAEIASQGARYQFEEYGQGSGFFFNSDGYILTNAHVVEMDPVDDIKRRVWHQFIDTISKGRSDNEVREKVRDASLSVSLIHVVVLQTGKTLPFSTLAGRGKGEGEGRDVAVIKVEVKNAPILPIGDSTKVKDLDRVWAVGYPGAANSRWLDPSSALEPSINGGTISALKRSREGAPTLQTDANMTHGSSGGPLLNEDGEVVGLTTFGGEKVNNQEWQGYGFAVASETAMQFVRQSGAENKAGAVDRKWHLGLEHLWSKRCSAAQEEFQEVLDLFSDHRMAAEKKREAAKCAATERPGMVTVSACILGFLLVGAAAALAYVTHKNRSNRQPSVAPAHLPGAPSIAPGQDDERPAPEPAPKGLALPARGGATHVFEAPPSLSVRFIAGPLAGKVVPFGAGAVLGREPPGAAIVIPDPGVSGAHAWIGPRGPRVVFVDRGSTNGSSVNGQPVPAGQEVEIRARDVVTLGKSGTVQFVLA